MSKYDDGGAAFPTLWKYEERHPDSGDITTRAGFIDPGMSLRDYFAAQALAGLLAHTAYGIEDAATDAYAYADAMLAERARVRS